MIDFNNGNVFKLKQVDSNQLMNEIQPLLIQNETVISAYKSVRDFVAFTTKRMITVNIQGITGKKKDFTSLPFSKIQAFSIETSGVLDLDSELELYFSGLGKVRLEFSGESNIVQIGQIIGTFVL